MTLILIFILCPYVYQAFPGAPYMAGMIKRIFINGLIKFASLFTKSKIVRRVKFVEMETVHEVVPVDSRPDYDLPRSQRKTRAEAFVKEQLTIYPQCFGAKNCLSAF